jgi:uncharacterized RDD family membrane protein YckC
MQTETSVRRAVIEAALDIEPANTLRRAAAVIIDTIAVFVCIFCVSFVLGFLGAPPGAGIVAFFGVWFAYWIICEGVSRGLTPGKYMLGIHVVRVDGSEIGWKHSVIRNLLRIVDAIPTIYLIGGTVSAFTSRSQRVGDLAARTIVVDMPRD